MKTKTLRLQHVEIPGIEERTLKVLLPDDPRSRIVIVVPQGGGWGGPFDLDKALLVQPQSQPPRSALKLLASLISSRLGKKKQAVA